VMERELNKMAPIEWECDDDGNYFSKPN